MPTIADKHFMDFRDTAITRLYLANVPILKIAAISGHAPRMVHNILRHYVSLEASDAADAMEQLKTYMTAQGIKI